MVLQGLKGVLKNSSCPLIVHRPEWLPSAFFDFTGGRVDTHRRSGGLNTLPVIHLEKIPDFFRIFKKKRYWQPLPSL
jgi:hypothetical protein